MQKNLRNIFSLWNQLLSRTESLHINTAIFLLRWKSTYNSCDSFCPSLLPTFPFKKSPLSMRHFLCLFFYWHFPTQPTSVGTYRLREVKQKPEKLNQKEIVHSPHTLDGRVRVLKRAPTRCYFAYCPFTGNLEHHKINWSRSARHIATYQKSM